MQHLCRIPGQREEAELMFAQWAANKSRTIGARKREERAMLKDMVESELEEERMQAETSKVIYDNWCKLRVGQLRKRKAKAAQAYEDEIASAEGITYVPYRVCVIQL